ncbi:unnamed protein product [Ambrosiozyma monospora]|uniref:Unnamed protein product n=1 Tax=Ambrosiozyma monospora TaxID=43982 RepID=A0A9W6YQ92_AMBMO|nr:unnamed protein product [Ambrosiozyma monospora]
MESNQSFALTILTKLSPLPFHLYGLWAVATPILLTIIPPKPYRKYISIPISFTILYCATTYPIDKETGTFASLLNGIFVILYLYTLDVFVVTEYPEFRNHRPSIGETQQYVIDHYTKPSWAKFWWCLQRTFFNIRGIGWNWEVKGLAPPVYKSRFWWVMDAVFVQFGLKALLFDVVFNIYCATKYVNMNGWNDPVLVATGQEPELSLYSGSGLPLWKQLVLALCTVYVVYFGLNVLHVANSLIWVVFRLCPVEDCSPVFGSFKGVYTVRSLWRNVWHRLMYQMTVPIVKFICFGGQYYNNVSKNVTENEDAVSQSETSTATPSTSQPLLLLLHPLILLLLLLHHPSQKSTS